MALRLTHSTLPPDGPPPPSELATRAAVLLDRGDLAGYRPLFARAAEHDDFHARYHTRCLLLEQGLSAAARASAARAGQIYALIAVAALDILEDEPREPILLNYAGVALYELWALEAAERLFTAARRLDPSLPNLRRNLRELSKRRQAGRKQPGNPALLRMTERAKRVARGARPASGLKLSLCMIVRDEEEMLPRCLAAIADAVDEIVVVDTGSRDRTIDIARSFGARVIEREWSGSFAEARNVSFDAATGDWLMYLDADEVLVSADAEHLRALTGRTWREAFYLVETNFTGDLGDGAAVTHNALRMFRNRPEYRFEGRLHEQIAHRLPGHLPERIEQTAVRVEHYGYLGAVRDAKEKSRRNIELLRAQQSEGPPTPFLHFNLGSEYAAAGDAPAALTEFERAWEMVRTDPDGELYQFTPSLISRLVKALRVCGRGAEAIARADEGLERFPGFTDLVLEQGTAALGAGRASEALEHYERCVEMGDAPSKYTATVGCGTYLPRIAAAEIHLRLGDLQRARELLDWCLSEHPSFFGTVLPYATALLISGNEPAAVAAEIERRVAQPTPTVRFMLATALYERGAAVEAEHQYRLVLERQPGSAQARCALGEALLSQKRYGDAASEAAKLPVDDPLAPVACRTELFGRLAGADLAGAHAAIERATTAGLPDVERRVFAGWAALLAGEQPELLPTSGAPLLAAVLEALLRVHDFESFELLLPLLERTALPARERRELLATIYLRRGFHASAAEEWMAVCEQEPDARALLGLARLAAAQGLSDDATTFVLEALTLEPENAVAHKLAVELGADELASAI